MDRRILFVVLGVAALALAGLAFAASGQGWNVTGFGPQDWNGTRMASPEGWNGTFRGHGMMREGVNGTRAQPPEGWNGTRMMRGETNGAQMLNRTARADEMKQFEQAVLSDDYPTAKNLSAAYGFGGPLFGKLNATTFATYSQIANLESQLRQELGMNATGMMPPGPMMGGPGFGGMPGTAGRGMGGQGKKRLLLKLEMGKRVRSV
ncbi:MAG: hypothetical protein NTX79_02100 [Candidatus Micrarchaeota archaeon]|nr:hypothetical protein [Candidatus Micrarchaeota archaeon]